MIGSFQLIRFEVIGKRLQVNRSVFRRYPCFQLIRFEVIGKRCVQKCSRTVWHCRLYFQLIRFEVIGKPQPKPRVVFQPQLPRFQLIRFEVIGKHGQVFKTLSGETPEMCFQLILFEVIGKQRDRAEIWNVPSGVSN